MKIVTIIGARPQIIKASMVSRELRIASDINEVLVHTGQHYDKEMSDIFFDQLEIRAPDYNLGIGSGSHGKVIAKMVAALKPVLKKEKPEWVLVFGDTNSTLSGALAATQLNIPLCHVEAGLRSYNQHMPEERNRVIVDHLSNLLFAPTLEAVKNLEKEGISGEKVKMVGDVMYDAALYYSSKSGAKYEPVKTSGICSGNFVLASVHRAENTDEPDRLRNIFEALITIADAQPVVLPLHPRTRKRLGVLNIWAVVKNKFRVIPPVGYLDMMALIKRASVIITDSGGLQKEAYFFNVPCLTLRDETEWVELVDLGVNRLVGTEPGSILEGFKSIVRYNNVRANLYGFGNASKHIVRYLMSFSVVN